MDVLKVRVDELDKIRLTARIKGIQKLSANLQNVTIYSSDLETYKGETVVTPKFEEQKLHTKNLVVEDDISVTAIPVVKVSNSAGGNTIIIGG